MATMVVRVAETPHCCALVWLHVTDIYIYRNLHCIEIYSDIYIIFMLLLYNCTGIYIVKYRQSIAFGNIYIGGHFLGSHEREKRQKTSESGTRCRLLQLCSDFAE